MKLKKLIGGLLLSSVLAAGVVASISSQIGGVQEAEATVWKQNPIIYFVASNNWSGDNASFKMNYYDNSTYKGQVSASDTGKKKDNRKIYSFTVSDGTWVSAVQFLRMNSTGSTQWNYSGTFDISDNYDTKANDGVNTLYMTSTFATYDNWTTSNSGVSWEKYSEDTVTYTVTKYKVINGGSAVSIGSETVAAGTTYAVPANRYEAGYAFDGWYTTAACTTKYTAKAINANTGIYAKYTTASSLSGTVYVDLRDSGWADAAANYAVKFYQRGFYPSDVLAWSTYVMGTKTGERLVEIPYSGVTIAPTHIEIMRYNSTNSKASWDANKDANLWSYTGALSITSVPSLVRIGKDGSSQDTGYFGFPKVIGGTGGAWADILYLDDVKLNGSKNAEYYSTSVTLAAGTQFKIQVGPYASGDYYGTYTTHDSIKSNFSGGGSSNINVVTAGTYAFYFDSYVGSLYITKVEIAEADEWAQYFLSHVGCDASGRDLPTGWTACATEYAKLSGPAKNIVYGATAKESGTYVEQAVARYDVAVRNHSSLTKFIVNSSDTPRSAAINVNPIAQAVANSGSMIAIIAISSVSIAAIGGYFLFKKKKND